VLGRIRAEKPLVWSFITGDGALWQEPSVALAEPVRRFG
jgi:hypothetical protein